MGSVLFPEMSTSATSNWGGEELKSTGDDQEQPRKWRIFHSKGLKRDQWHNAGLWGMLGKDQFGKLATEFLTLSQLSVREQNATTALKFNGF